MQPLDQYMPPLEPFVGSGARYWLDILIIFGVGLAFLIIMLVWARFFRSRRRHSTGGTTLPTPTSPWRRRISGRRRASSRYQRRNPTLAETRGLPPLREDTGGSDSFPRSGQITS